MLYSLHTDIKWDPWHYNGSINEWLHEGHIAMAFHSAEHLLQNAAL